MTDTATTKKRPSLLDLNNEMQALDDLLEEMGGDISEESVATYVNELFGEISAAIDEKVDSYVGLIRQKELVASLRKSEAERLAQGARTESNRAQWLKDRLMLVMEMRGLKKAGKVRTASICGNGGKLPLDIDEIAMLNPKELPPQFQRVKIELDTEAVRKHLEAGGTLEWARYGERGQHLRLK